MILPSILTFALFLLPTALATPTPIREHKRQGATTLKAAAGSSLQYFGAALAAGHLSNASDPKFALFAQQQFSGATPENEMKWDATEPSQGVFTFNQADQVASFAVSNNLLLRGHTLVWHSQLPAFVSTLTGNNLLNVMNNHIKTVMTHFKGKTFAWDVVNEAFNDDGTLRQSPFSTQLGPGFIQTAFTTARGADPTAKLYINDFNTEGINAKSNALLSVVKSLASNKLIDGVGFQSHFIVGAVPRDLQQNLQRFADVGVDVAITELDIRLPVPASTANLQQQARDYAFVVNACQAVSRCVGITTWGIPDIYSWVPGTFAGQGAALLFDDNYNAKPALQSTLNALLD